MNNEFFYRPPWTCGKYNAEKHVAIMFNLLSSSEYLFEAESADVVDYVLRAGKNGSVSVDTISSELDIAPRSIMQFFFSLIDCGLLTTTFVKASGVEISDLLHNNMIPVPKKLAQRIEIDPIKDTYLTNEYRYIRKR